MAKASDNLFPYVHLVPAAAPASPAAGSQRLYLDSGDSNKLKRKDSSGTVTTIEGGGSSVTEVLAYVVRDPGTLATYGPFTTNAETDVDATNLAITFTAPSSGKVRVTLEAVANFVQTSASQGNWCLREGSTLIDSIYMSGKGSGAYDSGNARMRCSFVVTGLTAGSSHTYKWAWRAYPNGTWTMYAGSADVGMAIMEVIALP